MLHLEAPENSYLYSMELLIRPIRPTELPLLEDFLYEALWQPDPAQRLPREVVRTPALRLYVEAFGSQDGDCCLVAEVGGEVVGAAWCRVIRGFGWTGERIPELAVALYPSFRGRGFGTRLLRALLEELSGRGFRAVSLSVQRDNPAARLYLRLGFRTVAEHDGEWVMRCDLGDRTGAE